MANTIKNSLRISMMMRSLRSLTNYMVAKRFINTSVRCGTNYDKEMLVSPRPVLLNDSVQHLSHPTTIRGSLKNCRSHIEVLSIVEANHENMGAKDTMIALDALVDLEKIKPFKSRDKKMYEIDAFLMLCELLKKHINNIEPRDSVSALKAMIMYDVPTSSVIVQMILQILRHSINDLPLSNISFVDYLLDKCIQTPLVKALKIALPVVYENNVVMKLDRENISGIKNALSYMSKKTKNAGIINIILHALMNCKQPMDVHIAKSVLWSLCDLQCYANELPAVLNSVQSLLAQEVTSLYRKSITSLIHKLSIKIKEREMYYYHEGFIDACASTAISEAWDISDAMILLDNLTVIGHTHTPLLDYIAAKCFQDPALLMNSPPHYVSNLVNACSAADYKPVFWETVQNAVTSERILNTPSIRCPRSKIATSLLALDCYHPELLAKVFEIPARMLVRKAEKQRVLRLYQAVKALYPQYNGPWPAEDVSELIENVVFSEFPMLQALKGALGGSSYVLTNVRSSLGHCIDHVVVMGNDGLPLPINDFETSAENIPKQLDDVKPPAGSQVILVLKLAANAYSINTQRMKGNWVLHVKALEALSGYSVIPVRSTMWSSLGVNEKIPYLMQAIKLKCEERSALAQS